MLYEVRFKPKAVKDIERLQPGIQNRILDALARLRDNLSGDVKQLTNFTPEYRLRVGQYRILFELESTTVVIYRIRHRRDAYR